MTGRVLGVLDSIERCLRGAQVQLRAAADVDWQGQAAARYAADLGEELAGLRRLARAVTEAGCLTLQHARTADAAATVCVR